MTGSPSYTCSICGLEHAGLPTDCAFTLPDVVWALPEAERVNVARWTTDLCWMGNDRFIRCMLPIPFINGPGYFGWGVWAKVERAVFDRYLEVYEQDASAETEVQGWLANEVPGYELGPGEPVLIQFGKSTERPTVRFPADARHALAREQSLGMNEERYHRVLETMGAL